MLALQHISLTPVALHNATQAETLCPKVYNCSSLPYACFVASSDGLAS